MSRRLDELNVNLAADVKERLVADSLEQGISLNDVAVGILAAHYRVRFDGTSRKSPGAKTPSGPVLLRIPPTLYNRIHAAAARTPKTRLVNAILREHYGLADVAAPAA